jgi:DNA-directed RNA polymerase subunit RPC12/RpoP
VVTAKSTAVYEVACKRCNKPIVLANTEKLKDEFTLKCQHCGTPAFYQPSEITDLGRPAPSTG